jgi:serine/threonine-protein kinase PknG
MTLEHPSDVARPEPRGRRRSTLQTVVTTGRLGAGLVEIPPVPFRDPVDAVLADPSIPEDRRICARCGEPVGRSRDGQPGRPSGFCRICGTRFSFEPELAPGELIGDQYEVAGCLAHGGLGWIYLARDRHVSDRWVVLKGLLNADDDDAAAAALAERRFLAEVEHPTIVKIFNFVSRGSAGYIVMEYVGGQNLRQILSARREANGGRSDPLPPGQAIAYVLESLPALDYLHQAGLVFCDFKPENVIQTRHTIKLIDLGGVHRLADDSTAVFGTPGFEAPEIAGSGPSIPSDLFTVARTLALLCVEFRGWQSSYRFTLPPPSEVELFRRHDSLYRFLLKGTAANPDDRFQSAAEMAEQLHGVLREVAAVDDGTVVPFASTLFTDALQTSVDSPDWRALPRPQVSRDDAMAGYLAAISSADARQMVAQIRDAPRRTLEVELRLTAAMIDAGQHRDAESLLTSIADRDPWEWRVGWYRGVCQLSEDRPREAWSSFMAVVLDLPGELAPKLALALALESAGERREAAHWYEIVSRTDPHTTSASFGLGRCLLESGDVEGAMAAYSRVPESSSGYLEAQTAQIRCLVASNGDGPALDSLLKASSILDSLPLEGEPRDRLTAELLQAALVLAGHDGVGADDATRIAGYRLSERDLRLGLEQSYRTLARHAATRGERVRLIDQANRARPRTWT